VPDMYSFLPGINSAKNPGNNQLYDRYDLAIAVDCASIERVGDALELYRNAKVTANIDHHISNNGFADINIIDTEASSTGEVIYSIAKFLNTSLTKDIAVNLFTAILTDTGGFKFENTRPETFEIAAELTRAGAVSGYIFKKCYESKPLAMVKLQAHCIDQAVLEEDNKIAYTFVSRKMLDDFKASDDHTDGISEALRQINTVEVAMVFKETAKGDTKVSFRSNRIDVCQIARFFGGGGHKLASGCTIQKNLTDSLNEVLPIVKKQINK